MDDERAVRLRHGREDRRLVIRLERAKIEHLGINPLTRQRIRRLDRLMHRRAISDDGERRAGAGNARYAKRDERVPPRQWLADRAIEPFVLEEDDRIRIADRRL